MSNITAMDPSLIEEISRGEQITVKDPNVPRATLNGALYKGNLYLNLLDVWAGDYSKELFITLLDKAEEAGCKNVILCLDKHSIRPFAFLGFVLLPPTHPLVPGSSKGSKTNGPKDIVYMGYQLEGDEDLVKTV